MNKTLPTLYSRRSDGKMQEWTIEVEGNSYRTIAGIQNGKQVISQWTICASKNNGRANQTTPEDQAMSEAQSHWQKKIDKKYSENPDIVDTHTTFQPMLAKVFEDYEKELFDENGKVKTKEGYVLTQPKFDGLRLIATKGGLFSRNGKRFVSLPHIEEALKSVFEEYPETIFDGEVYSHELKDNFNEICSHVKKLKPTAEDLEASKKVEYHVYDNPSSSHNFLFRNTFLGQVILKDVDTSVIKIVQTDLVTHIDELNENYSKYMGDGYEGLMVRLDKPYENKRSKSLLKMKCFKDDEFEILGIVEGIGNRAGLCGYMCFEREGILFKSNVKGNREFLKDLLINKEYYIGKTATVKYFGVTPAGSLRFPVVVSVDRESVE